MKSLNIRYIKREDIDDEKWDRCISAATNGLVYGFTFYLDIMSKRWDALVANDYEMVMPLTWNRKYTISYLYQPAFTPCLGVFGTGVNLSVVKAFISELPKRFRVIEISLNQGNPLDDLEAGVIIKSNYVLDLAAPYQTHFDNYRENIRRNIKKAEQFGVTFSDEIEFSDVISLCYEQMNKVSSLTDHDFTQLGRLCEKLALRKMAKAFSVHSARGQILASAIFFYSHQRAYYIVVGNHPDSRTYGASHYLIDQFIKLHAGQELLLDFEGSDIKNLAFFYQSFGSRLETYPALRINRLPALLKLVKG